MTHRNGALRSTNSTPSRRLIAAGIKRGTGPLVVEQPQSVADKAAHAAASYVRRPIRPAVA